MLVIEAATLTEAIVAYYCAPLADGMYCGPAQVLVDASGDIVALLGWLL